jgi:hypothetical protein
MNMLTQSDPQLKVYYHAASLGTFAGQEISVNGGIRIHVRHLASVSLRDDGTGFEFTPVIFVKQDMILYATALLGEVEMPENMRGDYLSYIRRRESALPN